MFKLFSKKEPKSNWNGRIDSVADVEEYYKEHKNEFEEFEEALTPLRDERSKARFIISQIYARHGINTGDEWYTFDYCLDSEVFTDLCAFNDDELASLRKWTKRYKDIETEMFDLGKKYRNDIFKGDK